MNSEELSQIFQQVAERHDYESAVAEFVAFADFKVQWQRSYYWIAFRISDYLKDAPEKVIEDLAESLFTKIAGKESEYGESMREWVLNPAFSIAKREKYIKRKKRLTDSGVGEHHNLIDIVDDLVACGDLPADHNIRFVWNKQDVPTHSVLMRVVSIPSEYDDESYGWDTIKEMMLDASHMIFEGAKSFK